MEYYTSQQAKYTLDPTPYLLITSPENYPAGWSKIETIDFLDGSPAFEILER